MAVASLVLGILSLIFMFIPGVSYFSLFTSIIGIILGALGKKDFQTRELAVAGLTCSIIAFIFSLIIWVSCVSCVSLVTSIPKAGY